MKPRLLFVGYGRAGKDEAGNWFHENTILRFAGTTSLYLAKYVAAEFGVTEEEAYENRHKNREAWKRIGDEIRGGDPGKLIREAFVNGEVSGGIRDKAELLEARNLCHAIIWVDNPRVAVDPTVTFRKEDADLVIMNESSLKVYHARLARLAGLLGVLKCK